MKERTVDLPPAATEEVGDGDGSSALGAIRRITLGLLTFVTVITVLALGSGYVVVGRGDPAVRLIMSFQAAMDLTGFAGGWGNWVANWPAGHFLVQGIWIKVLQTTGIQSPGLLSQGVLLLSLLAWLTSAGLIRAVLGRVRPASWGWLVVLCFIALPLFTELAHNAYGAVYFLPLFLACLYALARLEETGHMVWLVLAAAPLLVASTLRDETVVLASAVGLVLLHRHGWWRATAFLLLSSAFTIMRLLARPSLGVLHVKDEPMWGRILDILNLGLYLLLPSAVILLVLIVVFGSRMPALRGSSAREAVALYAGAGAGALLAFYFGAQLFLTSLGPDSRFLAIPVAGTLVAAACLGTRSPDQIWRSLRRWIVPWTVLASSASVFMLGIDFLTDAPRPPAGVREGYAWLRSQSAAGSLIAVDHIDWWQPVILIYSLPTTQDVVGSYQNWGDQSAPGHPPDSPPVALGSFLEQVHPAFVVRATTRRGGGPLGPAWTFLDAWSAEGRARLVVQNEDVMVYALDEGNEE